MKKKPYVVPTITTVIVEHEFSITAASFTNMQIHKEEDPIIELWEVEALPTPIQNEIVL